MLAQQPDLQPADVDHPTGVRLVHPGQQPQQRGLAVPVAADDADPLGRADTEADAAEEMADAVRLVDAFGIDQIPARSGHDGSPYDAGSMDRSAGDLDLAHQSRLLDHIGDLPGVLVVAGEKQARRAGT